jgi:cytochrome P450
VHRREDEGGGGAVGQELVHEEAGDLARVVIVGEPRLGGERVVVEPRQEPGHALGIALWALLQHPEALAEVRAQPELLDGAVEEALRWHSPVGTQTRQVTERTEVAGVTLEPGTVIAAVLASANQDERHWQQPERFDIHRTGAHAAFGLVAHHCAGASLARHEVRLPLRLLLERLPRVRLDAEPVELSGWGSGRRWRLHARWDYEVTHG